MTVIASARNYIHIEETQFGAGMSEATFQKIGGSINHLMDRIYTPERFNYGGYFRGDTAVSNGAMGTAYLPVECKIMGYAFFISEGGSGSDIAGNGDVELQFSVIDEDGNILGDLFTTTPKLTGDGVSRSSFLKRYDADGNVIETHESHPSDTVTGTINPTYLTLPARTQIRCNCLSNKLGSNDLSFTIFLAPQE